MAHIINVPYVSVWDGGFTLKTSADVNIKTGEITSITTADYDGELNICERQYIVMNDEQVDVFKEECGFDYWADIEGIYENQ